VISLTSFKQNVVSLIFSYFALLYIKVVWKIESRENLPRKVTYNNKFTISLGSTTTRDREKEFDENR